MVKKTAFCFRETVATSILRYLADDQPRKTTYSGLNKQLKVATEEHGKCSEKVLRRSASRAGQATETTPGLILGTTLYPERTNKP